MAPIRLSLSDIEFVTNDEIVLDDADVVLIDEPAANGRRSYFDEEPTRLWRMASSARAGARLYRTFA